MDGRRLIALTIGLILAALALVVWVVPALQRARLPEPVRAHVGIEVAGDGIARVGRVALAAGEPFRLHAIVEAQATDGSIVFYTEASEVRFTADERRAAAARTRPWSERREPARALWLTLEGAAPFRPLAEGETLERFAFEEFSHPEWGIGWVASGSLEARRDDALQLEGVTSGLGFGTQHYQVWLEILEKSGDAFPKERLKSPGSAELLQDPAAATAVEVTLPGSLGVPSRVFGLTQIEAPASAAEPLYAALAERYEDGLLFSRALLLRDLLEGAGHTLDTIGWRRLDLAAEEPWGQRVQAGDLLRVGARWVVLFRDDGVPGVVDGGDLCFDYERGAVVRRVSAVFLEVDDPEGGDVEWASLHGGAFEPSKTASAGRGGSGDEAR
jgi:hypothetical protein